MQAARKHTMGFVPLIEVNRGGLVECQHWGAVAVADRDGRVSAQVGDPYTVTFTRSTIKAFQALPFMQSGGARALGWGQGELALLCASHNGEPMHVAQAERMLASVGKDYHALRCGCHRPLFAELGLASLPQGFVPDERHNNCSGKHAGFVAHCVQQGLPLDDHLDPVHPLQVAIRDHVAQAVGLAPEQLAMGIEGCSAPNYAMPLASLARGYARLAGGAPDTDLDQSLTELADAMVARPELGSGTGRHDLDFMRVGEGDWVLRTYSRPFPGRASALPGWAARRGAQWIARLSTSAATPQTARQGTCPKGWGEIGRLDAPAACMGMSPCGAVEASTHPDCAPTRPGKGREYVLDRRRRRAGGGQP